MSNYIQAPAADMMRRYGVNLPGVVEVIKQPLYHYQTYAAAGATQFTFFQTPVGQGGLTLQDTNMLAAGAVPKGQAFVITAVSVELLLDDDDIRDATTPDVFMQDYYSVMTARASLSINIGSKPYLQQAPLYKFPPLSAINSSMAVSTTNNATTEGLTFAWGSGRPFEIVPLKLTSNQNFNCVIDFAAAVAVQTECRIGITFDGFLFRNAQ